MNGTPIGYECRQTISVPDDEKGWTQMQLSRICRACQTAGAKSSPGRANRLTAAGRVTAVWAVIPSPDSISLPPAETGLHKAAHAAPGSNPLAPEKSGRAC